MGANAPLLTLRPVQAKDLSLYYELYSDPLVMRYTLFDASKNLEAYLPYFLQTLEDCSRLEKLLYEYVAELSGTTAIGMCNIKLSKTDPGGAEIGYMLLRQHWYRGYATIMARELLRIGFSELGARRIAASCNANNLASERVMQHCGMHQEARLKAVRFKNGEWQDELRYAITNEEWSRNTNERDA